eukprot:Nk52_evm46s96 gene=Nk52_evmTU46s96
MSDTYLNSNTPRQHSSQHRGGGEKDDSFMEFLTQFDIFPKLEDEYVARSFSGGLVSIVTFSFMLFLVLSEFSYFLHLKPSQTFTVDDKPDVDLSITLDMTVKMDCDHIGGDLLDASQWTMREVSHIEKTPVHYELTQAQRDWLAQTRKNNRELSRATIGEVLKGVRKKPSLLMAPADLGDVERSHRDPDYLDGCFVHARFTPRKAAGNFHFTAGDSVFVLGGGHAHDSFRVPANKQNFTHRIERLAFGDDIPGIQYPLDNSERVSEQARGVFTYFLTIVPTEYVSASGHSVYTYQYSVREYHRHLTGRTGAGGRGSPGVFFKYDISDIKVNIRDDEEDTSFVRFLVQLCAIVGGVFATSGMLHRLGRKATAVQRKRVEREKSRTRGSGLLESE